MGWGSIPDDHRLMAGMAGLQTSHRYGNATMLASDFVIGIGNRWANRHTGGLETYTKGRKFIHTDVEPTQIGRVFPPDFGIVSDAGMALSGLIKIARERKANNLLPDRESWVEDCARRKASLQRKTHFDNVVPSGQVHWTVWARALISLEFAFANDDPRDTAPAPAVRKPSSLLVSIPPVATNRTFGNGPAMAVSQAAVSRLAGNAFCHR